MPEAAPSRWAQALNHLSQLAHRSIFPVDDCRLTVDMVFKSSEEELFALEQSDRCIPHRSFNFQALTYRPGARKCTSKIPLAVCQTFLHLCISTSKVSFPPSWNVQFLRNSCVCFFYLFLLRTHLNFIVLLMVHCHPAATRNFSTIKVILSKALLLSGIWKKERLFGKSGSAHEANGVGYYLVPFPSFEIDDMTTADWIIWPGADKGDTLGCRFHFHQRRLYQSGMDTHCNSLMIMMHFGFKLNPK